MVYLKIVKGMYGLPQAGKIANELLIKRMRTAGYHPCQFTQRLWRHVWRPVTFTFGSRQFWNQVQGRRTGNPFEKTLEKWCDVTVDWTGSKYVGISLMWEYKQRTLETSVPGFVNKALTKYQHPKPAKPQHAPAKADLIQYGSKTQ